MERTDFKRNFLKEIILRLDFQGVFQAEMEKILVEAKAFLKDQRFNKYEESVSSTIIGDSSVIKNVQSQIVYVFNSDLHDYTVSLSASYIILSVRCASYSLFEEYSKIFLALANIYKDKIDFFTVKRLGIRKINKCLIENVADVNKYFNSKYYDSSENVDNYSHIFREQREQLVGKLSRLNLTYTMGVGKIGTKEMLQIIFDSDVYMDQTNAIEETLYSKKHLNDLNDTLFSAYVSILTDEFQHILTGESEVPVGILGVEENE